MVKELKLKATDATIFCLTCIMFAYMVLLSLAAPFPYGRDTWFHILVARAWFKGLNGMVAPVVMDINLMPYPPLFHLLLAPFVGTLDSAVLAVRIVQTLLYPLGLWASMLLVRRYTETTLALLFGLLLTGTYYAFAMMQARPQSVETLLFPVAVWSLLQNKTKTFIGSVAAMFYLHSPISIAVSSGLLYYAFRLNKRDPKWWATILLALPIVVYQAAFVLQPSVLGRWLAQGDVGILTERQQFLADPLFWLVNGLGVSIAGFIAVPLNLLKWKELQAFDKVMLFSLAGFLLILPVWFMRVFHFAVIPLAYFTAKEVYHYRWHKWLFSLLMALIVIQAIVFTLSPVVWLSKPPYLEQYW